MVKIRNINSVVVKIDKIFKISKKYIIEKHSYHSKWYV